MGVSNNMKFKPLQDHVVNKRLESDEKSTVYYIIIPDITKIAEDEIMAVESHFEMAS